MERITIKSISIKRGTNEKGDWVNTQITPTEGRKWTGFIEGLATLKEGDVIDITEYEEGAGNKFNKILKYQKVASAPVTPTLVNEQIGMTPELWAEKDRLERWSRECIACFVGILELAKQPPADEKFKAVYQDALDWASAHFKPIAEKEAEKKAGSPTVKLEREEEASLGENEGWSPLKDLGQLYTRAQFYGLSPRDVNESVGVGKGEEIIDLDEAWMTTAKRFAPAIKAASEATNK